MSLFAFNNDEVLPSERLLNAASMGRLDNLIEAIDAGADLNYTRLDICPTLISSIRNYLDCFEKLIECGSRPDVGNKIGWTALHECATKEETDFLKVILNAPEEQCNLMKKDTKGRTAIFACIDSNRVENARLLIRKEDMLVSLRDNEGITPLMYAAEKRNSDIFQLLLESGADIDRVSASMKDLNHFIGDWEEGRELVKNTKKIELVKVEEVAQIIEEKVKPVEEVKANPFGLGIKRK